MGKLERIVMMHDTMDARGGATTLARLSAVEYKALGYEVVFITGVEDDGSLTQCGIETIGLGQEKLRTRSKSQAFVGGIYNHKAASKVTSWIKANDSPTTAYHLHNWAQILSPSIFSALAPVAKRTVVSCHDLFNVCPNGGLLHFPTSEPCQLKPMSTACWLSQCDRRGGMHKYWRMVRQMNLNRLARFDRSEMTFVSLHKGMEDLLRSVGFNPPKLTNIPNPATAYTAQRIECESNKPFLFVGRLTAEKGADIAIDEAKRAGVPIIMVGEGDLEDQLKTRYEKATFAGFCDRPAIAKYARQSRGIIVPSRVREPFGLVVAEGALSGLPVLISKQSMLSSHIESQGMGAAFDPTAPGDLSRLLRAWSDDNALTEQLSKNAYEKANEFCSSPTGWAQKFVDLMHDKLTEIPIA